VPFAMMTALVSNAVLLVASGPDRLMQHALLLGAQAGFYIAALVGLTTGSPALRLPAYFVLVNFAILTAWLRFARGERMTTWTPSERLRAVPHVSMQ